MKNKTQAVTINLEGDTLNMLKQAAGVNKCTLQAATQHLVDFGQGNLCDWSNEGFPMVDIEQEAKRGFAELQAL